VSLPSVVRARDSELVLARVRAFGFSVDDDGHATVKVVRDGRVSHLSLDEPVRYSAEDARDIWLLSLAIEEEQRWAACETYFLRRPQDDDLIPARIFLIEQDGRIELRHGIVGREPEMYSGISRDDVLDALPFLAAPNAIGYHRARARVIAAYEALRPTTWDAVGITECGAVMAYERHRVRPEDILRAQEGGIVGMNRIIRVFGVPADEESVQITR
jgi:hypothetical protein